MSLPLLLTYITSIGLPSRSVDAALTLLFPPPQRTSDSSAPTRRDWTTSCSRSSPGVSVQRLRTGGLYEAVIGDHRRMRDSPVRFAAENDEDVLAPPRITA